MHSLNPTRLASQARLAGLADLDQGAIQERNRPLVAGFVKGVVDAIHLFKTRPDVVIPLLQQFLQCPDRAPMQQLHAFYAPLFRAVPTPTFFNEMQDLCEGLAGQYPAARTLKMEDVADSSFVDELESSGYIEELYSG